jgi:iron(III) transport system substrate-binding protein
MKRSYVLVVLLLPLIISSCFHDSTTGTDVTPNEVLNIYTDRHYTIDDTLFARFEKEFGIKINVVKGDALELLARLEKEGSSTKADVFITTDVARIVQAKESGLFKSIDKPVNCEDVPNYLFDEEGYWFGLTKRARVIVYSNTRVQPGEIMNYEDLTDGKWKGKVAIRSKDNVYNQSLLASIIATQGGTEALKWVRGVVANSYQSPSGNDRDQVKAIYAGKADVALVNTYYLGKMLTSDDELEVAAGKAVNVLYPNQNDRGTHVNISGVGVVKSAQNNENASKLINYLLTEEVQKLYAEANFEFPVNRNVKVSNIVAEWGDFKEDNAALGVIGKLNTEAIKLFDEGGWK